MCLGQLRLVNIKLHLFLDIYLLLLHSTSRIRTTQKDKQHPPKNVTFVLPFQEGGHYYDVRITDMYVCSIQRTNQRTLLPRQWRQRPRQSSFDDVNHVNGSANNADFMNVRKNINYMVVGASNPTFQWDSDLSRCSFSNLHIIYAHPPTTIATSSPAPSVRKWSRLPIKRQRTVPCTTCFAEGVFNTTPSPNTSRATVPTRTTH